MKRLKRATYPQWIHPKDTGPSEPITQKMLRKCFDLIKVSNEIMR